MTQDFMRHGFDLLIEAAHDAASFLVVIVQNEHREFGEPTVIRAGFVYGRLARAIATAEKLLPMEAALENRDRKLGGNT